MEHFVAAPGIEGGVCPGASGAAAGWGKFHHVRRLAGDIRNTESGRRPKRGVGLN